MSILVLIPGTALVPSARAEVIGNGGRAGSVVAEGDAVVSRGCDVRVENGSGSTAPGNGPGNLVVGYDTDDGADGKNGFHHLVIGDAHACAPTGGWVRGSTNAVTGANAAVVGGDAVESSGIGSVAPGGLGGQVRGSNPALLGGRPTSPATGGR